MNARDRYPNALPARLVRAVEKAGSAGFTVEALRAMVDPRKYEDAREILGRLVASGRICGSGSQANRRWFVDAADALIWDEQRPRTDLEKRLAARSASAATKEQKRLARQKQLAQPRPRHTWTEEQIATLRLVYPCNGVRIAAEKTGQTEKAVRSKVYQLELKCTKRPPYRHREDLPPGRRERRRARKEGKPGAELIVKPPAGPAAVHLKKVRGPAESPAEPTYHPNFKFTRCPAPPAPMRTNTHSILL